MNALQSSLWDLGGAFAQAVAEALAETFQALDLVEDVLVLLDDGSVACMLELA
jgi:hypothetical protein